jgi:putative FmdB family regulatory protein
MPAYDFRCPECDITVEVTRKVGDLDPEPCPSCGGLTKRVFSPVGVVFKGSGFHNTDYRSDPKRKASPAETPAPCEAKNDSSACKSCPAAGSDKPSES